MSEVYNGLSGGIGSSIAGGNFWDRVGQGLITSGLNHAAHSLFFGSPPYKYRGKIYNSETELYFAILADQAYEQYGVQDFAALSLLITGQESILKPFSGQGRSKGTSPLSKHLSEFSPHFKKLPKSPVGLPKILGGKGVYLRNTANLGRFLGRWLPWASAGILAYDSGVALYNTQIIYNKITK